MANYNLLDEEYMEDEIPEITMEFRPTLVIGLGGTGHEVLVRLKARFLDTYGENVFKVVKLISFDTADESITVSSERGQPVSLVKDVELVNIGHVPVGSLLRNLDRHPTIKSWLPSNLPVRAITAGAKAIRPLGRLALFYHYNQDARVRDRLSTLIRSLANIKLRGEVGEGARVARSRGINVFVVASVCGGTGSGTFLDIAYLTKKLIENAGIPTEFCFINGVLVLPQAFAMVASDAIMANAYAALRELNHFTKEGHFYAKYPDGLEVQIHNRPFNICYLIDAVNEHGKTLTGLEDLAPMIAESIFLQIGSQVGKANQSVFDNVKSLDRLENGEPTAFSSLGTSSLVFPARRIIEVCSYRFGRSLIREGIMHERRGEEAENEENVQKRVQELVRQFQEKSHLLPKTLLSDVARDPKGREIKIRLEATKRVKEAGRDTVLKETDAFVQSFEVRRLNGDYRKICAANVKQTKARLRQEVVQEVRRIVDDPSLGPRYAVLFLEGLDTELRKMLSFLEKERKNLNGQMAVVKKHIPGAKAALQNAIDSFFVGRGARIAKARDNYLTVRQKQFTLQFEIMKHSMVMEILADLASDVAEMRKKTSIMADKFDAVARRFAREEKEAARGERFAMMVLATEITNEADVEQYYNQYARSVTQEYNRFLDQIGSLYALGEQDEVTIGKKIFEFAQGLFMPLLDLHLEDLIREKRDRVSPEERLEDLRADSVPFWNYDVTKMTGGGEMESIRVIGVEDKNKSMYRDMILKGETLISTRDPHRITVLHSKHGLPIFALRQIEFYEKKYEEHMRKRVSPLHLFPDLPWLEGEEAAYQWFALGQAFGFIKKIGVWYYCQPKDSLEPDIKLDQGLRQSLEAFAQNPQLVEDIRGLIEDRIKKIGNEEAKEVLNEYLNLRTAKDPEVRELEIRLKKLVRGFLDQMD